MMVSSKCLFFCLRKPPQHDQHDQHDLEHKDDRIDTLDHWSSPAAIFIQPDGFAESKMI